MWIVRELNAERREHAVKAFVGERQLVGVALPQVDSNASRVGSRTRLLEQLGCEIDAHNRRAALGRGDRDVAGPGRDVKDIHARGDLGCVHERQRGLDDQLRDRRVVARRPDQPLNPLTNIDINSHHQTPSLRGSPVLRGCSRRGFAFRGHLLNRRGDGRFGPSPIAGDARAAEIRARRAGSPRRRQPPARADRAWCARSRDGDGSCAG